MKHRLRRPFKQPAIGDPDYVDDSKPNPDTQAVLKSAGLLEDKAAKSGEPLNVADASGAPLSN